jgi:drug/metabolite transporter (DMT)-like permease
MSAGLLLGLGAALCWGLTDVSGALAGRRVGSLRALAFAQLLSVGVLVLVILGSPGLARWDLAALPAAAALGVAAAVAYLSFFTALRIGPITVVSPVVAAYGGLVVVLAVALRGESLTQIQAGGAAIATFGVILTGLSFEDGLRGIRLVGPGVPFAIVALVAFALVTVGLAGPIEHTGWLAAITWSRVGSVAAVWLVFAVVVVARPRIAAPLVASSEPATRGAIVPIVLAGVLDIVGFVSFAIGLEVADTWLVGLASSFGPAVAVLVAFAILGERPRRNQWLGFAAIAAGLVAVALP